MYGHESSTILAIGGTGLVIASHVFNWWEVGSTVVAIIAVGTAISLAYRRSRRGRRA